MRCLMQHDTFVAYSRWRSLGHSIGLRCSRLRNDSPVSELIGLKHSSHARSAALV